jgi:glycosyltransferase involved in cell wall biosynthesis
MDNLLALRAQWDREYAAMPTPHRRMRFHVIGLPATKVCQSHAHPCDTLTYGIRGIIRILHGILGHQVYFYGSHDSDIECSERVVINSAKDREDWYGPEGHDRTGMLAPPMDGAARPYRVFNRRAIAAMTERIEPHDFILFQGGHAQSEISRAFPGNKTVEWLIGYDGSFADFRVFQTYMHMAYTYGCQGLGTGRDFDDAGYGFYYTQEEFPYSPKSSDYFAFIGRPFANKGPHIAGQVCKHLGVRLVVAGQGARQDGADVLCADGTKIEHAEYVGVVAGEERAKLMGGAIALFAPTNYREPFASVTQEAAMCGTPSITSDHGCFPETIINGVNGYRCRTFKQYVEAAKVVASLDREYISKRAATLYEEHVLARRYQTYFERIMALDIGDGWYQL